MGPLLFTLYVNDIAQSVDCDISQYADDTLLFTASKCLRTAVGQLSENCAKIIDYFYMHKLQVNVTKTSVLLINPKQHKLSEEVFLNIQNDAVQPSNSIKYLGVIIDEKLMFDYK